MGGLTVTVTVLSDVERGAEMRVTWDRYEHDRVDAIGTAS